MYNFFYQFYKRPLGWELYSKDTEDGTPSPPISQVMIKESGVVMITENGQTMITEGE